MDSSGTQVIWIISSEVKNTLRSQECKCDEGEVDYLENRFSHTHQLLLELLDLYFHSPHPIRSTRTTIPHPQIQLETPFRSILMQIPHPISVRLQLFCSVTFH